NIVDLRVLAVSNKEQHVRLLLVKTSFRDKVNLLDSTSEYSGMLDIMSGPVDQLDARLIALLRDEPRIGLMEVARRLKVARGTVQARLAKLTERGVVRGFGPELDPHRMGYPLMAFLFRQTT